VPNDQLERQYRQTGEGGRGARELASDRPQEGALAESDPGGDLVAEWARLRAGTAERLADPGLSRDAGAHPGR